MANRILLAGRIHLSAENYRAAQLRPLFEVFVEDDEGSFLPKHLSAAELFSGGGMLCRNTFDGGCWTFAVELHDDDWWNTDHDFLVGALFDLKDRDGDDCVLACDTLGKIESLWIIGRDGVRAVEPFPHLGDSVGGLFEGGKVEDVVDLVISKTA